jgi:hypothetical protein
VQELPSAILLPRTSLTYARLQSRLDATALMPTKSVVVRHPRSTSSTATRRLDTSGAARRAERNKRFWSVHLRRHFDLHGTVVTFRDGL